MRRAVKKTYNVLWEKWPIAEVSAKWRIKKQGIRATTNFSSFSPKKFQKENIQISIQFFFPFPEFAHDAQTVCGITGGLHKTYMGWHCGKAARR